MQPKVWPISPGAEERRGGAEAALYMWDGFDEKSDI